MKLTKLGLIPALMRDHGCIKGHELGVDCGLVRYQKDIKRNPLCIKVGVLGGIAYAQLSPALRTPREQTQGGTDNRSCMVHKELAVSAGHIF